MGAAANLRFPLRVSPPTATYRSIVGPIQFFHRDFMQKESIKGIIYERIDILLSLAAAALKKGDEKHAKRYVFLARKLSTRYNCRMSRSERARFCKSCSLPLVIGFNCRVRLRKRTKSAEYLCSCGASVRFKY